MASINEYLSKILSARYGKDVRQSIHDSINAINTQVEAAENSTLKNANIASESAKSAAESEENAKASEELAEQYKNAAFSGTPEGYEQLVGDVALLDIQTSTEKVLIGSKPGGLKINTITGESSQKSYTGKNLIDCSGLSETTTNGITFTPTYNDNGELLYINVNGTATADTLFALNGNASNLVSIVGASVTLNGCPSDGGATTYRLVAYAFKDGVIDNSLFLGDFGSGVTKDWTGVDGFYSAIGVKSGTTVPNLKFYPMLRLASVKDETYEPYVGGIPSPNPEYPQVIENVKIGKVVTCGKNLMKSSGLATKTINGVTFTPVYDGEGRLLSIHTKGTATSDAYYPINSGLSINEGDYIYTQGASKNTDYYTYIKTDTSNYYTGYGSTVHISTDTYAYIYVKSGATVDYNFYPMLRLASVSDSTYEPYMENSIKLSSPVTLRGIGDVKDQIIKKDGVWGVLRNVVTTTLNGSESWGIGSPTYRFALSGLSGVANTDVTPLCTHLQGTTTNTEGDNTLWLQNLTSGLRLNVFIKNFDNDLNSFKNWLASNPITIGYATTTPTFEPLPTADQIAINSLLTFDTVTNINFDSPVEPKIDVEYGTSKVGGYGLQSLLLLENVKIGLETQYLSEVNLNDYITPMTAICDFCDGVPYNDESGSIGLLEVFRNYPMGYILQRYTYYGGHIYIRRCYAYTGNDWSEWIQIS